MLLIDIGKAKHNYNKDKKPRYFNYNIYRHIVKDYGKFKKKKETKKYYKYNKMKHLTKNYRSEQKMKNRSIVRVKDNGLNFLFWT